MRLFCLRQFTNELAILSGVLLGFSGAAHHLGECCDIRIGQPVETITRVIAVSGFKLLEKPNHSNDAQLARQGGKSTHANLFPSHCWHVLPLQVWRTFAHQHHTIVLIVRQLDFTNHEPDNHSSCLSACSTYNLRTAPFGRTTSCSCVIPIFSATRCDARLSGSINATMRSNSKTVNA